MKPTSRCLLAAAIAPLLAAACVSPHHEKPQDAVYCPKCETVWVEFTDFDDPYRMSTVPAQTMRCPDCESAVATFFRTGQFEHSCKTCGDVLVHCTAH